MPKSEPLVSFDCLEHIQEVYNYSEFLKQYKHEFESRKKRMGSNAQQLVKVGDLAEFNGIE